MLYGRMRVVPFTAISYEGEDLKLNMKSSSSWILLGVMFFILAAGGCGGGGGNNNDSGLPNTPIAIVVPDGPEITPAPNVPTPISDPEETTDNPILDPEPIPVPDEPIYEPQPEPIPAPDEPIPEPEPIPNPVTPVIPPVAPPIEDVIAYQGKIVSEFNGWSDNILVEVSNGNLWKQIEHYNRRSYAYRPNITVYQDGTRYYAEVDGIDKRVEVEPILSYIKSKINGTFNGWDGDTVFELMDGSTWQQDDYQLELHLALYPLVYIYNNDGISFYAAVEGTDKHVKIKQYINLEPTPEPNVPTPSNTTTGVEVLNCEWKASNGTGTGYIDYGYQISPYTLTLRSGTFGIVNAINYEGRFTVNFIWDGYHDSNHSTISWDFTQNAQLTNISDSSFRCHYADDSSSIEIILTSETKGHVIEKRQYTNHNNFKYYWNVVYDITKQ